MKASFPHSSSLLLALALVSTAWLGCTSSERPIDDDAGAEAGTTGSAGSTVSVPTAGTTGSGAAGHPGVAGTTGTAGSTGGGAGHAGTTGGGTAGNTGTAGSTGVAGSIGTAGTTGAAGSTGAAGTTGAAGSTGTQQWVYSGVGGIENVLINNCGGCHFMATGVTIQGGFWFSYANVTGVITSGNKACANLDASKRRVVPGHPESSLLYIKISIDKPPAGCGGHMPYQGQKVNDTVLGWIRDWILQGAKP